ncbi:unnamed protein product, partial [Ectocarpus sp. 12 AP-2014]
MTMPFASVPSTTSAPHDDDGFCLLVFVVVDSDLSFPSAEVDGFVESGTFFLLAGTVFLPLPSWAPTEAELSFFLFSTGAVPFRSSSPFVTRPGDGDGGATLPPVDESSSSSLVLLRGFPSACSSLPAAAAIRPVLGLPLGPA